MHTVRGTLVVILVFFFYTLIGSISLAYAQSSSPSPEEPPSLTISQNPCRALNGQSCTVQINWRVASTTLYAQVWERTPTGLIQRMCGAAKNGLPERGSGRIATVRPGTSREFLLFEATSCLATDRATVPVSSRTVAGLSSFPTPPPSALGINSVNIIRNYFGISAAANAFLIKPGTDPHIPLTERIGRKVIEDARDDGMSFIRVPISGWFPYSNGNPSELDLWLTNPEAHWAIMDRVMNDFDAYGVRMVPVLNWHIVQYPAMTGEVTTDLITNPSSKSYLLFVKHMTEFINRYKKRKTILFYEIGNEYQLHADIDMYGNCIKTLNNAQCTPKGNFTSEDLRGFYTRVAAATRLLDPTRMISSGDSVPRPAAAHLRRKPQWIRGGDFTSDSQEEFTRYLIESHEGLDLVSIHLYNASDAAGHNINNRRFGVTDRYDASILNIINDAVKKTGKKLYIGEFGDNDPFIATDKNGPFIQAVLGKIAELNIPYSSPWVYQYYAKLNATYTEKPSLHNIEQGYTDVLLEKLRTASAGRGSDVLPRPTSDSTPPRLVVTWPLHGTAADTNSQEVYAVASDATNIKRVTFSLNDKVVASLTAPPYRHLIPASLYASGTHTITVTAFDAQGNWTRENVVIRAKRIERTYTTEQGVASTSPVSATTPTALLASASLPLSNNLRRGMTGEQVRSLQSFLVTQGTLAADSITGFFGTLTEQAVQQFQCSQNIVCSGNVNQGFGLVGPKTRSAIASMIEGS